MIIHPEEGRMEKVGFAAACFRTGAFDRCVTVPLAYALVGPAAQAPDASS